MLFGRLKRSIWNKFYSYCKESNVELFSGIVVSVIALGVFATLVVIPCRIDDITILGSR